MAQRGPGNKRLTVTPDPDEVGAAIENLPIEPERIALWRRLFQISQFVWRPGAHWKHLRRVTRYLVGPKATRLYKVIALPGLFQLFRWWTKRRLEQLPSAMTDLVRRLAPDILIHPTVFDGYFINDFVLVGRKLGIPTIAVMNSWDNPSTKRAVVDRPDWVLVWGPQTKAHAVQYMGMRPEQVVEFGAAQFDVYAGPPRVSREEFCRLHGIDPAKILLLYAGSSKGADEYQHLSMLSEAIASGELGNVAVLYRPHPWGDGGYRGERILDAPLPHVVVERSMYAYLENVRAGKRSIHLADYADTHDVLSAIDVLISPLSTIILEAALHGKPVMCLMAERRDPHSSFKLQADLVHFHDLYRSPAVLVTRGEEQLIADTRTLLARAGDADFDRTLRTACRHFVTPFDRRFADRIVDFVHQQSRRPAMSRPQNSDCS
jgi:hypothetical protein